MTLQGEEILELIYYSLYDLPLSRSPAAISLRPSSPRVVLGSRRDQHTVALQPVPLPPNRREALIRQVSVMALGGYDGLPDGPLVACARSQTESGDDALGAHRERYFEALDPFRFGAAPPEGGLTGE
jgi:hypothetical protein